MTAEGRELMSVRFPAWSALLLAAAASSALSQEVGDRDSGERLAALNCAQCHRAADVLAGAPAFATVASMPSTTAEALNAFLQGPHATMADLNLSPGDRSDLVAYILSLRP
jgi:mono/diheme cytochrome c family protein